MLLNTHTHTHTHRACASCRLTAPIAEDLSLSACREQVYITHL